MSPAARTAVRAGVLAVALIPATALGEPPAGGVAAGAPQPSDLVDVLDCVPDAKLDIRYATPDNFLKQQVYPEARCVLRRAVAERLAKAAAALKPQGFGLILYDGYRPRRVQWKMWAIFPKPGYVANPKFGSNHNRGAAVDLSLYRLATGAAAEMPTDYDTFTQAAHHGYTGGTAASRANREALKAAMTGAGFVINRKEWWHYDDPGAKAFAVLDIPFEEIPKAGAGGKPPTQGGPK